MCREVILDWTYCLSPVPLHPAVTCYLLSPSEVSFYMTLKCLFPWSLSGATSSHLFLPTACFVYSKEHYDFHIRW